MMENVKILAQPFWAHHSWSEYQSRFTSYPPQTDLLIMVSFNSVFLLLVAFTRILAAPHDLTPRQTITSSQTGTNGGYYYMFYTDGKATVDYTNEAGGEYNVKWSGSGDFVAGKGWATGSAR